MSVYPESELGIWLNTPIKCLETTAEQNLRAARNDARWSNAANDSVIDTPEPTLLDNAEWQAQQPPSGKGVSATVSRISKGVARSFATSTTLPLEQQTDPVLAKNGIEPCRPSSELHLKGLNEIFVAKQCSGDRASGTALLRTKKDNNRAFGLYQRESYRCLERHSSRWRLPQFIDRLIGSLTR